MAKFPAVISAIGNETVSLKLNDKNNFIFLIKITYRFYKICHNSYLNHIYYNLFVCLYRFG